VVGIVVGTPVLVVGSSFVVEGSSFVVGSKLACTLVGMVLDSMDRGHSSSLCTLQQLHKL